MKNYWAKTATFFNDLWSLHSFKVIIVMLIILGVITPIFFKQSMWDNIFAGTFAGFIIIFFHVFIDFEKLRLSKIIKSSCLKNMLEKRNDKFFYERFLSGAKKNVDIMGISAVRFFQDFGSVDEPRLIDQLLDKGVIFRFLLTDCSSDRHARAKPFIDKYKEHKNFEIYYFNQNTYIPQSIFVVDDECILGPIFSKKESKDTAALHFSRKDSGYAIQYINYFDNIWSELKGEKTELVSE